MRRLLKIITKIDSKINNVNVKVDANAKAIENNSKSITAIQNKCS